MAVAVNFIAFQIGWFACVLGAAHGHALEGALVALAIVAAHIALAARPSREFALVAAAAATGAAADSLLAASGWLRYDAGVLVEGTAPYWIVAMWALFAITLNVSMRALRSRLWLGALLGLVGGPAAYYAGANFGALTLVQLLPALAALAAVWALATPMLLSLALRLERS
jgi:Protein of unknown function (DUF2878)